MVETNTKISTWKLITESVTSPPKNKIQNKNKNRRSVLLRLKKKNPLSVCALLRWHARNTSDVSLSPPKGSKVEIKETL